MNKKYRGQLLIEVMIGVSLIAIFIVALVPVILGGTAASAKEDQILAATFLAKEEIEAAKALKEENWNNLYFPLGTSNKGVANLYHPVVSGNGWQLAAGTETIVQDGTNFQRYLTVENVSRTGLNAAGEIEPTYNAIREDPSTQKITATVTGFGGLPVTINEYFSRWRNQIWSQTDWTGGAGAPSWQDPPANKYFSGIDVDTTAMPAAVVLAQTGPPINSYFGNHFLLNSTSGIGNLSGATYRSALRFRAQQNGNVTQLRINLNSVKSAGSVVYRYGLQADNAGNPAGVYLGSATASFNATGWQTVNLPQPIAVSAGTTYHLVVQYDSGQAPTGNRYINLKRSAPLNQLAPKDAESDSAQNTLFFNGLAWSTQNSQPLYLLGFSDNSFEGNPYESVAARSIYGNIFEGQIFTPTQDKTVKGVRFYLSKNSNQNPNDFLYVTLKDLTAGTTLVNNFALTDGADLNTSYGWLAKNLPASVDLMANHQYRLYLSSPASASNRYYRIYAISAASANEYAGNTWGGTIAQASRSTNGGSAWTQTVNTDLMGYDLISTQPSYAPWGELVSSTYDVQNMAGFNRLYWETVDLPSGTTVKMQLATNNDNTTWNFRGPQGTATDYYTISAGENIWTGLYNNRYLRYKIRLETTNPAITPAVGLVKINLSP